MLVKFRIEGWYQSSEQEDPEVAVAGLTPRILVDGGQGMSMEFQVNGEHISTAH